MKKPVSLADRCIAKIDSSSTMLLATANYLRGKDISGMGFVPPSRAMAAWVNAPPKLFRKLIYIFGGRREAVLPKEIARLSSKNISQWVVQKYPRKRTYPAVMIGSSGGALIHLCAALGIPWLPQTVLVPVRRRSRLDPDAVRKDMESFKEPAARFLERNPGMQINQMRDPVQDRLMIRQMGYFRIKYLRLDETYERFLKKSLPRGGTLMVAECRYSWPMSQLGPRHYFQVGGYGGLEAKGYLSGGPRVARFLKEQGSRFRRWDIPKPDANRPEAEWGFEPELLEDLRRLAKRQGWRVRRLVFEDPADVSPLVADLYRDWYRKRGIRSSRILAEDFLLLDPWWCLRTGSIPFWMVFNTGRSARELERYIRRRGPFNEVYLTLFANSVLGMGQTSIQEWRSILRKARLQGDFIGVDEASYPYDLGVYFRFHPDLKEKIHARFPMPEEPLRLAQWERFLARRESDRRVRWLKG
ncbi:MAG: hypothetical protein Q7J69_01605 [Candidatus Omnitrophota bacterium]|nr:hypothetical protein [Candidatus Omnitrophota bacterium]